jgi:phosphate transport system substrate-binding protein
MRIIETMRKITASLMLMVPVSLMLFPLWLLSGEKLWASAQPTLRISGSSTLLPVLQAEAEVYLKQRPELLLTVSGTGSGEGLRSLIDGNIDLASASRDIKKEEQQRAADKGLTLYRQTIALDCLAVIVHPSNEVENLTLAHLKGIYDGTFHNWKEVGGADRVIVPINRDSSSGTFEMWVEKVLKGDRHRPDAQVQSSSGGVAYAVAGNRYAIGYVSLGFLSDSVKAVKVEGFEASAQTALNGSYPIVRDLYLFFRSDKSSEVDKFVDFMLSADGASLIRQEGFLPPPDSERQEVGK